MTTEKIHWSDRARDLTWRVTEFVADHGATLGMTGATVAGAMASACMVQALGGGGAHEIDHLREAAATFILTGTASALTGGLLEKFAHNALGEDRYDSIKYDRQWMDQVEATFDAPKGAVPVIDDPTRGPEFKEAMRRAMDTIDKDPVAKAKLVNLLARSPEARMSLVNDVFTGVNAEAKDQQETLQMLRTLNQADNSDIEESPHGPRSNS